MYNVYIVHTIFFITIYFFFLTLHTFAHLPPTTPHCCPNPTLNPNPHPKPQTHHADNQTVLSPICTVESSDTHHLDVPFVLTLPHCAGPLFKQWTFSVYCRHDHRSRWQVRAPQCLAGKSTMTYILVEQCTMTHTLVVVYNGPYSNNGPSPCIVGTTIGPFGRLEPHSAQLENVLWPRFQQMCTVVPNPTMELFFIYYTIYIVYTVHCTVYTVQCTMYTVHCILQVYFSLYITLN